MLLHQSNGSFRYIIYHQPSRERELYSSLHGFNKELTLVSYVTHVNRAVILLSSQHHDAKIDERNKKKQKPEIITYYNRTKCGVDVVDQMCEMYNVARTSRKWPWVHMFNLINISAINARVIYRQVTDEEI